MLFKKRVRKYTVDRKNINWSDRITQVECIPPNQCMWMKKADYQMVEFLLLGSSSLCLSDREMTEERSWLTGKGDSLSYEKSQTKP